LTRHTKGVAGLQFSGIFPNGTTAGKLVYLTFPFEAVYPQEKRSEIIAKVMNFFDTTTETDKDFAVISEFKLRQNYPNPFNPSTKITYQLPKSGFVELTVYDMGGKKVESLVAEEKQAGIYTQTWNASNRSSGVYIYAIRIASDGILKFSQNQKCVLIK
jgi:hypothetical protein